ncbi:HmuY family protein [Dyadobacter sp. CY312]|uniref:HmuY family protein n=1 Tax=Dyadobacter sp. CY312 TaxID=2907303 RepID=UPI001F21F6C1|nr:HmuY family protein [Dyadobacter sp. CY312]MCE7043515.1 HmuY family protein [Dyadobacter sp. CY312]
MNKLVKYLLVIAFLLSFNACKDDEPPLPDNVAGFESTELGFDNTKTEVEVKITLSRAETAATAIKVDLTPTKLVYGTDFTTDPVTTANSINVSIPAGQTSATIKVKKTAGITLNGDENIAMKISSVATPALTGTNTNLKLSFSAITSTGSNVTLNGKVGDVTYANSVYFDLSGSNQTGVDRKSWNLGFYSGADFRVILNPAYQSTAKATTKTDINAVTLADSVGIALNHNVEDPTTVSVADDWTGDLTKTAIAEISATEAENKVYVYSFEGNKSADKWFKVKITRNGTGYKVQYARLGSTTIKTLDVAKNADFNFVFASLETDKVVSVEPRTKSWDFSWSYSTYNSGLNTPYWVQDYVAINKLGGVSGAQIMNTTVTYADFKEANIAAVTWSTANDVIGTKWRGAAVPGTTTPAGVRTDRFYVIKDGAGNVYKIQFLSYTNTDGGERGKPTLKYELVKKGA